MHMRTKEMFCYLRYFNILEHTTKRQAALTVITDALNAKKRTYETKPYVLFFACLQQMRFLLSLLGCNALLSDTSLLTGEVAQVVQLGAANLTNLVDSDAVDVGRLDGEDTLHTNGA